MATQMSYNRARSTQKIFLNNYWMEIDGHYTFRTLLVVYLNVSTLRKYVLLQEKKRSTSYSRRYFCFFFRRKWFSLTIIAQRAFPCCILVISWMSLFTPPWKLMYYGLWRRLFIPVPVLAVLFLSDQMPILATTYFTTLQSGCWSRCRIVNEDMKIKI